jgi:hypothetical protein
MQPRSGGVRQEGGRMHSELEPQPLAPYTHRLNPEGLALLFQRFGRTGVTLDRILWPVGSRFSAESTQLLMEIDKSFTTPRQLEDRSCLGSESWAARDHCSKSILKLRDSCCSMDRPQLPTNMSSTL